jgi:hypothetical protein
MKLTKRQKLFGLIGLVIVTAIIETKIYLRQERIRVALEFGHLAKLPDNSSSIKVDTEGGMFSRTFWLTFESTPAEIDNWIRDSNELVRKDWENSSRRFKVRDEKSGKWREIGPESIRQSEQPDWFDPEKLSEGELYEVSIADEALYGKVWVDRKNGKVFVLTSHS